MTDLPAGLREKLDETACIGCLDVLDVQEDEKDGTRKFLFGCRRYPFLYDKGGLMYLLIDNYDSFTYNLADLVAETGCDVQVCRCDQIGRNEMPYGLLPMARRCRPRP